MVIGSQSLDRHRQADSVIKAILSGPWALLVSLESLLDHWPAKKDQNSKHCAEAT